MIATLSGRLAFKSTQYIIINIYGIGFKVCIPLSTYYKIGGEGEEISLYIHTYIRQEAIQLFGFYSTIEKELFESLIAVSKIGPKIAINILSSISSEEFREAILINDIARLSSVPGVGTKTAQRLVIELRDKLKTGPNNDRIMVDTNIHSELLSALMNLGYKQAEAEKAAIATITRHGNKSALRLEEAIKMAIKLLSNRF